MDKNSTVGNAKIRALFDAGTFVEVGAYVKKSDESEYDGMICGYGSISGKLTFAFAQDMERMKGAFGAAGAAKISTLYRMAQKNGAPILGIFESAGALVYDGSAALSAYGTWMKCAADASGVVPQIAICSGICAGSAAVIASMFDFVLTVEDATQMYVTTPAAKSSCCAAICCQTEAEAVARARELVEILPQNNRDRSSAAADDVNRTIADAKVESLADFGKVISLYTSCAPELQTSLGYLGGELVVFVSLQGKLTQGAAKKAAKMVTFADSFRIPVITLVDSDGVPNDATCALCYAKLASAYATATTPRVTAIVGDAYGAAFTMMGSRALGADLVLATPDSQIGAMTPEKSVAFLWNDKVTDKTSREDVEAEWIKTYALPERAASCGDIDDIVAISELRMRLCSAVYMLADAAEDIPTRRHATLPH